MAYADYDYYKYIYKGVMPSYDFDRLSERASDYIDNITFNKITDKQSPIEVVKKACCAIAETMLRTENGIIQSEGNGKYNVSYSSDKTTEQQLYSTAKTYLGSTGLLYRGMKK